MFFGAGAHFGEQALGKHETCSLCEGTFTSFCPARGGLRLVGSWGLACEDAPDSEAKEDEAREFVRPGNWREQPKGSRRSWHFWESEEVEARGGSMDLSATQRRVQLVLHNKESELKISKGGRNCKGAADSHTSTGDLQRLFHTAEAGQDETAAVAQSQDANDKQSSEEREASSIL